MLSPEVESFFVAIALQGGHGPGHGHSADFKQKVRRLSTVATMLRDHPGAPEMLAGLKRNYAELGGRLLDIDPMWFWTQLAGNYLKWLDEQFEQANLHHEPRPDSHP